MSHEWKRYQDSYNTTHKGCSISLIKELESGLWQPCISHEQWYLRLTASPLESAKRASIKVVEVMSAPIVTPDQLQTYLIEQNRELFEQCRIAQRDFQFMERCGRSVGDIADKLEVENAMLRKQIAEQSARDSEIKALRHLVLQLENTLDSGLLHSERVAECHLLLAGYYGMFGRPKEEEAK